MVDSAIAKNPYKLIVDAMDDVAFVVAEDLSIQFANQAAITYASSSLEEIQGMSIGAVTKNMAAEDEDPERFIKSIQALLNGEEPEFGSFVEGPEETGSFSLEFKLSLEESGTVIADQRIKPVDFEDGSRAVIIISREITERKNYEEALEQVQEELRQIIDLVPDPIFAKNRDGEYLLANKATAEAFDLKPEDLKGKQESELTLSVEDSKAFRENDLSVIDSGKPKQVLEELTTAEGETRVFQTTKIPYEVIESDEDALLGYARDVTELKKYEQELEDQRDNLEVLNQVVRHDIRNDLLLVLSYAEMLEPLVEGEDAKKYVGHVLEAARDAVNITNTARDVTEVLLQSDREPSPVRLETILKTVVDEVQSNYDKAVIEIDGSTPPVDVVADGLLDSVFRNLLSNSIQHNDKETPEVTVSGTQNDDTVVMRFADNGPGISDERKESIFTQGETGLDSEGSGLGLYIVDTLVNRYGGDVGVEDNDPEGTIFIVELPIAE